MVLWNFIFLRSPVVFTIQWLAAGARITISGPYDPDLPGHSDKHKENGSRGYGCQTRESEIISPRNPDRASNGLDGLDTVCSGIDRIPTVSWVGPPTQGSNGMGNKFAFVMIVGGRGRVEVKHSYSYSGNQSTTAMEQSAPADATLGLNLIAPPPGNETFNFYPSQQLFFNGIYNGIYNGIEESK
ncbi:hypothetical protein BDFG_04254 [Blastomyces dermatitidis ATCC 26199]|nr:hypothetical protein BDFG_04254 [Blastomyces dermatitidis ATCC 26199]